MLALLVVIPQQDSKMQLLNIWRIWTETVIEISKYQYRRTVQEEVGRPEKPPSVGVIWLNLSTGSKKTTPNVRRILMSQKTFANHLADEEAALAQQHHIGSSTAVPRAQGAKLVPNLKRSATSETNSTTKGPVATLAPRDPLDDEPLLKSYVPTAPSGEEMEALLSGPPLSYNAARTAPPPSGMPQRQFCEICGYWGTIKCVKCGARVCGLECKIGHDDSRCLKFYT